MGCGKSSVGRELSRLLCCPFMDLDEVIEQTEGRAIPEIFASDGEAAFRQMELKALKDVVALPADSVGPRLRFAPAPPSRGWQNANSVHQAAASLSSYGNASQPSEAYTHEMMVLALGGGTVMTQACREIVQEQTLCIYLKASVETLLEHLEGQTEGRPMLSGTCHSERAEGVEESSLRRRILELMAKRAETYEKTAHIILETDDKSIKDISQEISRLQKA